MLKRIKSSDLIFSGEIEDDRTNTYLHLLDYDWMNYMLQTRFKTKEQGLLDVSFEYCGMTKSQMRVKQTYKGNTEEYVIDFPTDVFEKHIKKYMRQHIRSWNNKYAFYGGDIVIAFYNDVLNYQKKEAEV